MNLNDHIKSDMEYGMSPWYPIRGYENSRVKFFWKVKTFSTTYFEVVINGGIDHIGYIDFNLG